MHGFHANNIFVCRRPSCIKYCRVNFCDENAGKIINDTSGILTAWRSDFTCRNRFMLWKNHSKLAKFVKNLFKLFKNLVKIWRIDLKWQGSNPKVGWIQIKILIWPASNTKTWENPTFVIVSYAQQILNCNLVLQILYFLEWKFKIVILM